MPEIPSRLRRLAPRRLRDDVALRALAVGRGWIPPRTMHSRAEAALLARLASEASVVVEIGVYEGASAGALRRAMSDGSELHLIDPFGCRPTALPAGWGATEQASRRVVQRARSGGGPRVIWHIAFSDAAASSWERPVDLVFIDGDHSEEACRLDWELWSPFVAPGGHVIFHDARRGQPAGDGLPGPTAVVDALFRGPAAVAGWAIAAEIDRSVAVRRTLGAPS